MMSLVAAGHPKHNFSRNVRHVDHWIRVLKREKDKIPKLEERAAALPHELN